MRSGRAVEDVEVPAAGVTIDLCGGTPADVIGDRNPVRIGRAHPLSGGHLRAEKAAFEVGGQRIVQILHHKQGY
jgi:hypothetical protein